MYTKRLLHLINRPSVDQQTRIDTLAADNSEFQAMADELWETRYIEPKRRREIHDAIDAEIDRLLANVK